MLSKFYTGITNPHPSTLKGMFVGIKGSRIYVRPWALSKDA